ncbi:MAG: DNA repair exonuclease [Aquificota bacterium]|nr:MAG: DNA repair exonuclease [Aquificota bacterium]
MKVTFIHAADLHLGTPFKGLGEVSPWLKKRLIWANFEAFRRLVDLAREADMLLLAGDLLEVGLPHLRARLELVRALGALAGEGVRVFLVAGNHDPYPFWREVSLPMGVHLFSPQGEAVEVTLGGSRVGISGISHGGKSVKENLVLRLVPVEGDLRLALLHAYLQGQEGHDPYAPCSLGDLVSRDFNYWALGHIHKRQVVMEDPWVVYPGNLQGRHPGEVGQKGCYRVVWDGERCQVDFRPLSPVVWATRLLSLEEVDDSEGLADLLESVKEEVRWEGGVLLRVVLEGPSPLHSMGDEEWVQLEEVLNEAEDREDFVWLILEDRLLPPLDLEGLASQEEFLAQLVKEAMELKNMVKDPSLGEELGLLWRRRDVARWLGELGEEERARLVDEALKGALVFMLGER